VVQGVALELLCRLLFTEGSNPSLSVSVNSPTLPTTMKFLVRGKSVDFLNREGSSQVPLSPIKSPFYFLTIVPTSIFH
jgi:hypothetical protein